MKNSYSIIIPAYNEGGAIGTILETLLELPHQEQLEIVVVNDGSSDNTAAVVSKYPVTLLQNVSNFGYGHSLKVGITHAKHQHIVILDADGSYPVDAIPQLISFFEKGFDMVVGARQGAHYHGSLIKRIARIFFRALSEFSAGRRIPDINSGLRVFRKDVAIRFFHTLSSGFSFTTTITLAFMLNAYSVAYVPVAYHKRKGHSKVHYVRDTLRSTQIIVESIATYNPLKLFLLIATNLFGLGVLMSIVAIWYPWSALLLFLAAATTAITFSFGLIAVFFKNRTDRN